MRILDVDKEGVSLYGIAHIIVFVWSFIGGGFFWVGYSLENAIHFAIWMTVISLIFSWPGFFVNIRYQDILVPYLAVGTICGAVLVVLFGAIGILGRVFSAGPEAEVLAPLVAAAIVGGTSVFLAICALIYYRPRKIVAVSY